MADNPAWKTILDVLPAELHAIVKPELEKWDKGVNARFQEIHGEYAPFKQFKEQGVTPQQIANGLDILGQINQNPKAFAEKLDEVYNLNLIGSAPPVNEDPDEDFNYGEDITKHPAFKQMSDMLQKVLDDQQNRSEREKEQEEASNFEAYLDSLESKYKEQGVIIDRTLVTAYMAQGLDGDAAVKAYQERLAQAFNSNNDAQDQVNNPPAGDQNDNPPAVMGSSGSPGSGIPDTSVTPGNWNREDTNKTVMEMLRLAAEQNQ